MNSGTKAFLTTAILICSTACGQEPGIFSGPQAGEALSSLEVKDALDATGKAYDLVAKAEGKPSILIFIHDLLSNKSDEPSLGLSYVLSHYAAQRKDAGLVYGVVYLTDDVTAMRAFLAKVRRALPKQDVPLVISTDGLEGPGSWGLNRNVRMTVVISKDNQVTANFALQQPSVSVDAPKILAQLIEVIGGDVPSLRELDFPYYIGRPDDNTKESP